MKYLVLGLCFAMSASADPILLAQFETTTGIGPGLVLDGALVQVPLSYGFGADGIESPCVGCNNLIAPNVTGSMMFDSSNTPDWTAVTNLLTDGINETFYLGLYFYHDGVLTDGGGGGQVENQRIGAPDLAGDTITTIQRNILQITNPEGVYTAEVQWQFWGTGTPTAPQINLPEAGGFWPFALLPILIGFRHELLGNQGARP